MRIRFSARGLTFSFAANETFHPGTHYRYVLDTKDNSVILIPEEDGKYVISRKGENQKALVDLRNKEIKNAISLASFMEVEIRDDVIIVHVIEKEINVEGLSDRDVVDLFDKEEKTTICLDKAQFLESDPRLMDALAAAGIFSEKVSRDVEYIFDVVSLFSGAGLLDLPFAMDSSFDIRFAVDFNKAACETYRHMIGDHILCMDMKELDESLVPSCELIIGGPCCQGYSNANRAKGDGLARKKRELVGEYIRIVKAKKPLIFLMENVPQLLSKDNSEHLERILTELSEYEISYSVVNDNDVGGYSTRKRVILIGSLIGRVEIPNVELFKKATCMDALSKVDPTWNHFMDSSKPSEDTMKKMAFVGDGENYRSIPELSHLDRHSSVYKRLDPCKPSVTITNWRKVLLMPPIQCLDRDGSGALIQRQLSCAEAMAIQGLPKHYRFFGNRDDIQQMIGNGVTQAMAAFACGIVKNALYRYVNATI